MSSSKAETWGDQIAEEEVGGVIYRMYSERPRQVKSLLAFTDRWGDRPHIVQGERMVSFAELRNSSLVKSRELSERGVGRGARVFILGWNSPDWIINFWACQLIGAIPVLANGWWSKQELTDALSELQPELTLADAHGAAKMPPLAACGPWETSGREPHTGEQASDAISLNEEEIAVIIFTAGTTGRPKAVMLSHRGLLAGLQMLLHITRRLPHQVDETAGVYALHTGPLFHVGGVQTLLRAIMVGDTLVMPTGKFEPAEVLELIERHKISRWSAVPTMVTRTLDHPDVQQRDLHSLRSLTVGGAPVHAELLQRIPTVFPSVQARIPTGYGLTENGGQATAASGKDTAARPGSSGRPLPCVEIKFLPHARLPDGEILLRAPTQMSGYYGTDESPIDQEGWLHTGDLGRVDDKGHLWLTGRSKEMIIRGGENIAPAAIERALVAIQGVAEALVFGVPHPDLGEEVMAIVVIENDLTPEQIQDQLRKSIASFSIPSRWRLQKEPLPLNHSGKLDKAALIAQEREKRVNELEKVA